MPGADASRGTARARTGVAQWVSWLLVLALATLAMLALRTHLDKAHVALIYLLVILGASAAGGRLLGLSVVATSFVLFNVLFLPPYYTLVISNPLDWLVLVAFLATSVWPRNCCIAPGERPRRHRNAPPKWIAWRHWAPRR
ncbi:MAG: DUF4118 domain-containing protein [Gemmatimonadaceae bacterium]